MERTEATRVQVHTRLAPVVPADAEPPAQMQVVAPGPLIALVGHAAQLAACARLYVLLAHAVPGKTP